MTHRIHHTLTLKNIGQQGQFSGYASIFHHVDADRDTIAPHAFVDTLKAYQEKGQWPKMLWQHDPQQPIGKWLNMHTDDKGLYVEGQLFLDLPKGKEAYTLLKEGVIDSLSIGFKPRVTKHGPKPHTRAITALDLYEISLVTFPANDQAKVTALKSADQANQALLTSLERAIAIIERCCG